MPLVGLEVSDPHADLTQVEVRPIATEERLGWRLFMARYHYLGYRAPIGEHLLYAAFLDEELVALLGWAAAALRAPLRERYHLSGEINSRVDAVERAIALANGRLVVVETSSRPDYGPTRAFYEALAYRATARIPDFYAAGDDLIVYTKQLVLQGRERPHV